LTAASEASTTPTISMGMPTSITAATTSSAP
jgi:hypothetical protein